MKTSNSGRNLNKSLWFWFSTVIFSKRNGNNKNQQSATILHIKHIKDRVMKEEDTMTKSPILTGIFQPSTAKPHVKRETALYHQPILTSQTTALPPQLCSKHPDTLTQCSCAIIFYVRNYNPVSCASLAHSGHLLGLVQEITKPSTVCLMVWVQTHHQQTFCKSLTVTRNAYLVFCPVDCCLWWYMYNIIRLLRFKNFFSKSVFAKIGSN